MPKSIMAASSIAALFLVFCAHTSAFDAYASLSSGSENCCAGQTLYVATNGWSGGDGVRLVKDDAGEWGGALATILKVLTARMSMGLVFLEEDDCVDGLQKGGAFDAVHAWDCKLVANNVTVPISRFSTLWLALQWGIPLRERGLYVSTSFIESETAALLHVVRKDSYGIWRVFAPFEPKLWVALFGMVLVVSLVMPSVLRDQDHRTITEGVRSGGTTRLNMLYYAASEFFGGGDLEWTAGPSSKLLHIGWLFFVLVTTASYTANLAAFFTAKEYEVRGPTDMTSLRNAVACIPDHANDPAHLARMQADWGVGETMAGVITANMPDEFAGLDDEGKQQLWSMPPPTLLDKCAERIMDGQADFIMYGRDGLTAWLLDRYVLLLPPNFVCP